MRSNPFAHGDWVAWQRHDPKAVCPKCKKKRTKAGHDPCLGELPGVANACCGHGMQPGYIQFDNGTVIRMQIKVEVAS